MHRISQLCYFAIPSFDMHLGFIRFALPGEPDNQASPDQVFSYEGLV